MNRVLFALVLCGTINGGARGARAQSTAPADDSSKPIAAWASGSLGVGAFPAPLDDALAVALRANVSVGPLVVTWRHTDVNRFESDAGMRDDALLAGLRTDNRRLFATIAAGYAVARPKGDCGCGAAGLTRRTSGLAYDVGIHANALLFGAAMSFSGIVFAPKASYLMVNLGVEAGWFGT